MKKVEKVDFSPEKWKKSGKVEKVEKVEKVDDLTPCSLPPSKNLKFPNPPETPKIFDLQPPPRSRGGCKPCNGRFLSLLNSDWAGFLGKNLIWQKMAK